MNLSYPARTVVPSLASEVLLALAGTTRPLTGRQVHRLTHGTSWSGVRLVLQNLEASGLADVFQAGSASLYTLNREHVAAEAVLALVDLRGKLFELIRHEFHGWTEPPLAAAVFGSAARGDGTVDSDIDVFIVRPEHLIAEDPVWSDAVASLAHRIRRLSGNPASIIQATPAQIRAMVDRGEPILVELRRDLIHLYGLGVLDFSADDR